MKHRNLDCLGLHFPFDTAIKEHIQQLPFIRWSRTHRCFYMEDTKENIGQLLKLSRGIIWIDFKTLTGNKQDGSQQNNPSPVHDMKVRKATFAPIPAENLQKIASVVTWMEQKRYAYSTIKTYSGFLKSFFAFNTHLLWNELTKEHIIHYNYEHFIKNNLSFSSQNQWINAIKLFIAIIGIKDIDLDQVERPRRKQLLPNVLTVREVEQILRNIKNVKHQCLIMLLYGCGLRISEALSVLVEDVRSKEGLLYIRQSKGGKDRRVPLSPKLVSVIRAYYRSYKPKYHLFEGQKGGKYSASSARSILEKACREVGIKRRITLHTLRHSYATHLTNKGINIQYLQEILGHQSPKTTMLYTHLSGKDIKNVMSPLDDIDI